MSLTASEYLTAVEYAEDFRGAAAGRTQVLRVRAQEERRAGHTEAAAQLEKEAEVWQATTERHEAVVKALNARRPGGRRSR